MSFPANVFKFRGEPSEELKLLVLETGLTALKVALLYRNATIVPCPDDNLVFAKRETTWLEKKLEFFHLHNEWIQVFYDEQEIYVHDPFWKR